MVRAARLRSTRRRAVSVRAVPRQRARGRRRHVVRRRLRLVGAPAARLRAAVLPLWSAQARQVVGAHELTRRVPELPRLHAHVRRTPRRDQDGAHLRPSPAAVGAHVGRAPRARRRRRARLAPPAQARGAGGARGPAAQATRLQRDRAAR